MNRFSTQALTVFLKELGDALRDRRTLMRLLLPNLLMGPLMLFALSSLIASLQERADQRTVQVAGIEHAPTLANYIERQTYTIKTAPPDYEKQLHDRNLLDPVLVVPKDFEAKLAHGEQPTVELVADSANERSGAGLGSLNRLLHGFNTERATLNLALRGVSVDLLQPVDIQERDLANTQARMARMTGMIPFFVMVALFMGALTAALDSTAGERERGSLEPLLMNPAPHGALVLGKWGAVALMGTVASLVSSLSFIPAQWFIQSDSLQAMFRFSSHEALAFWLLQIPLAAAMSAALMAIAIRTKSFKEAQASTGVAWTVFSLVMMIPMFNTGGDAPWYHWVPGLAQSVQMTLVLKGESVPLGQLLPTVVVCAAVTVAALVYVARSMRAAVAR